MKRDLAFRAFELIKGRHLASNLPTSQWNEGNPQGLNIGSLSPQVGAGYFDRRFLNRSPDCLALSNRGNPHQGGHPNRKVSDEGRNGSGCCFHGEAVVGVGV